MAARMHIASRYLFLDNVMKETCCTFYHLNKFVTFIKQLKYPSMLNKRR